jgi:type II secretory pathway pseudopilin PulG
MQRRRQRRREGTTLIELMVVLVIMAAMAAAVAMGVMNSWTTAKKHDTESRARTLQSAVTAYLLDHGGECPSVEDLDRANILDQTTEHTDAWDRPFKIDCEEEAVHIHSPGPDGTLGNEDDLGF